MQPFKLDWKVPVENAAAHAAEAAAVTSSPPTIVVALGEGLPVVFEG